MELDINARSTCPSFGRALALKFTRRTLMATDTLTKSVIEGDASRPNVYRNFIDGEWVESASGETFENRNPADTRDVVGIFQKSVKADVDAAVDAAKRAFVKWRLVPAPRRAEIIYLAAEMLAERKEEFARDMTREMGKALKETRGDVQEAVDTAYYMAGEGRRLFGPTTPSELPNKFAMAIRQPVGVCGMITPWNFPMAIPSWKLLPALVCGNTCVIKPAQDTPLSTFNMVRVLADAGVPKGVYREFVSRLVERAKKLRVGNGLDETTDMGPAVNERQLQSDLQYVDIGKTEGAKLQCGGNRLDKGDYRHGFFIEPTIFSDVDPKMRIAQEEIFGPVVSIIPCEDFEDAIQIANNIEYGLSSAIYTRDVNKAFTAMRDLYAGITYINAPTIGAEVHLPFGGVKATGNGHREGGIGAIDFYTEWKSVYVDYSDRLQRAQIDRPE